MYTIHCVFCRFVCVCVHCCNGWAGCLVIADTTKKSTVPRDIARREKYLELIGRNAEKNLSSFIKSHFHLRARANEKWLLLLYKICLRKQSHTCVLLKYISYIKSLMERTRVKCNFGWKMNQVHVVELQNFFLVIYKRQLDIDIDIDASNCPWQYKIRVCVVYY